MTTRVPRSRTFTGCGTCRARHFKCDEARPVCNTCRRLRLPCQGYAARLQWVADQSSDSPTMHRHTLFNEHDRRLMTLELSESTGGQSAIDMVLQLDAECERRGQCKEDECVTIGPFGAFRAYSALPQPPPGLPEDPGTPELIINIEDGIAHIHSDPWDAQLQHINIEHLPSPQVGTSHGASNLAQQGAHLMPCDVDGLLDTLSAETYDADLLFPHLSSDQNLLQLDMPGASTISDTNSASSDDSLPLDFPILRAISPVGGTLEHAPPAEVSVLLRYCKANMAGTSSRSERRLSPWQRLFIPCVMETFGEITLGENTSCTRLAIFYAVLANSAFHLHNFNSPANGTTYWLDNGVKYQKWAKDYLKRALQTESAGPSQAKYKELLMAVLSMAIASVFNEAQNIRAFLQDAERLILLRGIPNKKKSFKLRLLHHMYTHLRIIAESTFIPSEFRDGRHEFPQQPHLSTGSAVILRTFRLAEDSLNANLDPSREKTLELGYNDIHLEVQGKWHQTMYPDIYGVPESLMTLLSQTICLANEKKRLDTIAVSNAEVAAALSRHTRTLEQSIWSWSAPGDMGQTLADSTDASGAIGLDHGPSKFMVLAMHQALLIYFYRRVYNVNAMILQEFVRKTLDHLLLCVTQVAGDQDFAATISWSGFIAACEAVSPDLQEKALQCLSMFNKRSIFFASKEVGRIAQEVWTRRKDSGDCTISWPDLMTHKS